MAKKQAAKTHNSKRTHTLWAPERKAQLSKTMKARWTKKAKEQIRQGDVLKALGEIKTAAPLRIHVPKLEPVKSELTPTKVNTPLEIVLEEEMPNGGFLHIRYSRVV